MSGLTVKQEKFVNKYLECGNATKAYRYAYSTDRMKEETVNNAAYKLLQRGEIKARLDYLKSHLAEAAGISALQILREHQKIAFSDATRIRKGWMDLKEFEALTEDERACIKSIETKEVPIGVGPDGKVIKNIQIKVTLFDKQKSLESICQMLGYNAPVKAEVQGILKGLKIEVSNEDTADKLGEIIEDNEDI